MRVGHILTSATYPQPNFDQILVCTLEHGGTYDDPITGKPRQFDYRCRIARQRFQNLLLAVECKNLNPSSPLVVCGRPRTYHESYHHIIMCRQNEPFHLKKVEGKSSLYEPERFVGKSLLRLKGEGKKLCAATDTDIYERWSQALASSVGLANRAGSYPDWCFFVMPLVVVPDGLLWAVDYNEEGKVSGDPTLVDECDYYVDRKITLGVAVPFVVTHIHFVTLKGLSKMLSDYVSAQTWKWDKLFSAASTDLY